MILNEPGTVEKCFGFANRSLSQESTVPYKSYEPSKTVEVICQNYKELVKEIKDLKKAKGDKKKIKKLEEQLKTRGQKISKLIDKDFSAIEANFKKHFAQVDTWLGQAAKALSESKKALENLQNNPTSTRDQGLASIALPRLQSLATQASQDADDYGASWFRWRGWNGTKSFNLDKSVVEDAYKLRRKLMSEQKQVQTKIKKLELMVKDAKAVKDEAESLGSRTASSLTKTRTDLAILRTDLNNEYKRIRNEAGGLALSTFERNIESLQTYASSPDITLDLANAVNDVWANAMACVRFYIQIHKSMETRFKSGLRKVDKELAEDATVKKELAKCHELVDKAHTDRTVTENALKQGAKYNATIQKAGRKAAKKSKKK